jgi:hypothetical protein
MFVTRIQSKKAVVVGGSVGSAYHGSNQVGVTVGVDSANDHGCAVQVGITHACGQIVSRGVFQGRAAMPATRALEVL